MSTSVTNGTRYSAVGKDEKVDLFAHRCTAIMGIVFAVVYIGVAGNFYFKINSFEDRTRDNCTRTTEHHLSSVCEDLGTWSWCAIAGVLFPGLLNLIYASFMLFRFCYKKHQVESETAASNAVCNKLWTFNSNTCSILNLVIFFILWATRVSSTQVTGAEGLELAGTIYMYIVGLH